MPRELVVPLPVYGRTSMTRMPAVLESNYPFSRWIPTLDSAWDIAR